MLFVWRFLMGYLSIVIEGNNNEQILNCAASNGINIWDLYYRNGMIFGKISAKNYFKLFSVSHHIKCKIKILKKYGVYFRARKYKYRIGHFVGICFFTAIILFLSRFVWVINIEGNQKIPASEIISSCNDIGIRVGMPKEKINSKYDSQRLQLQQNNIAWCSLNLEGSVLTVNLSEADNSQKDQRQKPSNLKATIDGKIEKIDISSGNSMIKVGDVVSKGQLLVSGIISNMQSTHFVHSSGDIIAKTKRVFSSQADFRQTVTTETGECITRYTLEFFNVKIPLYLGNVKKENIYENQTKTVTLFGKKTPIKIAVEQYKMTKKSLVVYDTEKLEKMLYDDILHQVKKYDFITANEYGRETIQTEKGILMKITYDCTENIATQDEIILSKVN